MQNVPEEYVLIAVFSLHNSLVEKTVKKWRVRTASFAVITWRLLSFIR